MAPCLSIILAYLDAKLMRQLKPDHPFLDSGHLLPKSLGFFHLLTCPLCIPHASVSEYKQG